MLFRSRQCVVVEDAAVGLRAAKAAGMRTLVTYTASTAREDFYGLGADAKLSDLCATKDGKALTLDAIFGPIEKLGWESEPELLRGIKD